MEMTLIAKILWFCWVFLLANNFLGYIDDFSEKVKGVFEFIFGLTIIITTALVALMPFVNLLWK